MFHLNCLNSLTSKAKEGLTINDLHRSRPHLCMTNTRTNSNKSSTIAETIVKAWAVLLGADWIVIIDMGVSVKPFDLPDTRAKKTFTDQQTINKKSVNRAEALAQNICNSLLQSRQFCRMLKGNRNSTPKTLTEVYKLFTDKEELRKPKETFLLIIKYLCQFHTKRIWKTYSQNIGYINREPEKCLRYMSALFEHKSRKWSKLITLFEVVKI